MDTENTALDLSEEKVERLSATIADIMEALEASWRERMVSHFDGIERAAKSGDEGSFRRLVVNNTLFGGSGALWEKGWERREDAIRFCRAYAGFIDVLHSLGIRNSRIKQVKEYMWAMAQYYR